MSASDAALYDTIATTVKQYTKAFNPSKPGTNTPNRDAVLSLVTQDFIISFGHEAFVASYPPIQGMLNKDPWMDHWQGITQNFDTWTTVMTDLFVDVRRKSAVVRSTYTLIKGEAKVVNDMVQFMKMDESGKKVQEIVEFMDAQSFVDFEKVMKGEKEE